MRFVAALTLCLAVSGCTCDQTGEPDAAVPLTLAWPEGAKLEITATTASSADLRWPEALGAVATYRLTSTGTSRDELGRSASLTGLTLGQHVAVEVIAVAADGSTTPPLKAEVAPAPKLEAPEGDISTDFCGANAFLLQGTASIPCELLSVVVGHVRTREGVGVPGMRISVLNHPEWGAATSQADGLYALAVTAGRHTLELRSSSFLPIQRLTTAKARDFTYLPDTVVLRRDEKSTAIVTAAGGFHSATPQEDEDGQRTTSVFIPPGTNAWLRLTDGGTQPTATITLRATEATVGPSGPEAMPASLPGATAYTFAADISADEAISAGARGIGFATPVAIYAENFLHYPVGAAIPLGVYDEATGRWESGPNAAVLQVTAGGGVDYTGDGNADADFPLLPGEAAALEAHYAPGSQLVRSLTKHFSAMDTNSCWLCIGSCTEAGEAAGSNRETCPTCQKGSVIRVQNRTLSEFFPVSGTDLQLAWHSNRFNVRKAAVHLKLGLLRDGGEPQGVVATYFRLEVAGRRYEVEHSDAGYGDATELVWDGKDAFGRTVKGPVAATSATAYGFAGVSVSAASGAGGVVEYETTSFGVWPAPGAVQLSSTRAAAFFLNHTSHLLGDWVPRENLGNLSLDILHGYSADGTLHLGTGAEDSSLESGAVVKHVAGGGNDYSEDAGLLTVNLVSSTAAFAEGPQGIFYLEKESRVRLLRTDGGVSTVAGDGSYGFSGDGLPATQGRFNYVRTIATDPSGNLYLGDVENYRIRRVDAVTGLLSTVVGNGQRGFSPDGTIATEAKLDGLSAVLFGHDGHLYFMAQASPGMTLRRVENGVLTTVAGGNLDNRPPWESTSPKGIAFRGSTHWLAQGVDGTLYVAGYDSGDGASTYVVRSIEADGRVRLRAGGGDSTDVDEVDARKTCFSGISGLAVAADGTLYVGETGGTGCGLRGPGVRAISPDGTFSLFLGGVRAASSGYKPPDGAAALTQVNGVGDLIMRTNGSLLVMHRGPTATLHEVAFPTLNATGLVPSRDGEEAYAFDARGRHIRTVSARSGLTLWRFGWGTDGLASITDRDGDVTTVERRSDGSAQALVAQDGQRTELQLNATTGRVERVTDTMGRFVEAAYDSRGLLSEWKDLNGHATAFTWDSTGNLLTHTNARGAKKAFEATASGVDFTSPEGRLTRYERRVTTGRALLTTIWPDATEESRTYPVGRRSTLFSDGTVLELEQSATEGSRFGRNVDAPASVLVRTPGGVEGAITRVRTITTAADLLDVTGEVEETRVNGRLWVGRYDGVGKTYEMTSPEGRIARMTFDPKLRPSTVTSPGILPITYAYDGRGRLTSATQGVRSETITYDLNGFADSTRNALDEVNVSTIDKSGRLQKSTRADTTEVTLERDPVGNLTSVTPPDAGSHLFLHDKANQKTAYIPPAVAGVGDETTTFDREGLVTGTGYADSTKTIVTREPSGRVTQLATPWWANDFTYVPMTGRVASVTRGQQRLEWQYDGFLEKEEKALGVAPATSQWTYDSDFRRATHTINGSAIAYAYDNDSLLTQAGAAILTRSQATGQLATLTVGSVITAVTHNGYGELANLATTAGSVALYSEGLSYDAAGRITLVEEINQGVPVQWVYGYDKLGRLTSASKNGAPATTWTYDGKGNRLTEDGVRSTFDAQDRLLTKGTTTYEWDALCGRTARREGSSVTRTVHDGWGALTSMTLPDSTVLTWDYDGRHRRVARRRNGTVTKRWIYDGQARVVAEVDGTGLVTSRFVYGAQSHSPDYLVRGGLTFAFVKNHLGSIKAVVDAASGAVAQRLDYDPWGNITADSSPGFQPFAFAGGIHDAEAGLTHFGFRDYDPNVGAWTSKDPMRLGAGLAFYGYAQLDPVGQHDALGLWLEYDKTDIDMLAALRDIFVDPVLGPKLRKLMKDPNNGIRLTHLHGSDLENSGGGETSPKHKTEKGFMCESQVNMGGFELQREKSPATAFPPHTWATLIAHELGHGYGKLYNLDDDAEAFKWENRMRVGPKRPETHVWPSGPGPW